MAEAASGPNEIAWSARKLLRSARQASLATVSQGQPFVSLATPAVAPDGGVLLLLSDLSEHTRHLRADPRCSMLVAGLPNGPNPQTTPRLTANATAAIADTPADRARFLAIHPYAGLYAGFGDFHLWRLTLTGGLFVGGFAVAHRLAGDALRPGPAPELHAAEADILAHCNDDHAPAMAAMAESAAMAAVAESAAMAAVAESAGGGPGEWRMVTCDTDGFDLAQGETTLRISFAQPVATSKQVRAELIRLARWARSARSAGLDPPAATP